MTAPSEARPRDAATQAYSLAAIPPQPYGKYTLIGKLGHGGMAEVNLAVVEGQGGFRKLTVIKRLHRHLAMEPGFVEMFLDEARLAAQLNHPHCVQTFEVGEHASGHYLAMEYLDGQGLERLLRISGQQDRPIDPRIAARIVTDALEGLAYAHELTDYDGTPLTVVHRDVSPQNIFITYDGMVKLLDFGIAKAATHVVETQTGVIKGKYAYISPEQALGQEVDQRSDLWSMGVVLWETLTGRRLFKSVNELATLHETIQGEIKLPSAFRPELSTELDTICMRALQRDPAERYQSAQEMKDDLERYLLGLPRRAGRKEVAAEMRARFEAVIALHERTLAECLAGTGRAPSEGTLEAIVAPASSLPTPTPSFTPSVTGPPAPPASTGAASSASAAPASTSTAPASGERPTRAPASQAGRPSRTLRWVALAAVLGLAALLALVLPLGGDDEDDRGAVDAAAAAAAVGAPHAEPSALDPASPSPLLPPAPSDPALGDLALGDPALGDPALGDPALGDPALGDPGLAEPGLAEPALGDRGDHSPSDPLDPAPGGVVAEGSEPGAAPTEPAATAATEPSTEPEGLAAAPTSSERRRRTGRRTRPEPTPAPPAPAPASGFLTLATTPWTEVSLGGRSLGTTPLLRVELPAGTHALRLVNREQGVDETYRVTIRAGETLSRRVGLR